MKISVDGGKGGGGGEGGCSQGANLASLTDRWAGGGRTKRRTTPRPDEDDDRFICQSRSQLLNISSLSDETNSALH